MASNSDIVKAWEKYTGREGEFEVVSEKDESGLETTRVRNITNNSTVAEVNKGDEDRLLEPAPAITVRHKMATDDVQEVDNSKPNASAAENQTANVTADQLSTPEARKVADRKPEVDTTTDQKVVDSRKSNRQAGV